MKRSVIQLAGRTLLVSLPAKWVDANNVKKGDELDLIENGASITINTDNTNSTLETKEFDAESVGPLITRYLFALYKKGIDEIKINYNDPSVVDVIRKKIMNEAVGYEIISQSPKSCVIKLITSGNITEFDNLLRRSFLLLLSMADETLTSIKNKDLAHLSKTALLEEPNDRLALVCRRTLNKTGSKTYSKIGPIYYIIEELENVADEYGYLCNNLYSLKSSAAKNSIRPEVVAIFEEVNEVLRMFYESFYKLDMKKLIIIAEKRKEIVKRAHDIMENKKPSAAELYVLHHGITIAERVHCMSGPHLTLLD